MNIHSSFSGQQRGSALVTTMMLSMALLIIIASILGYSLSERRLNYREAMRLEARNAAEAMAEYGMAQVHDVMQTRFDMTSTRFTTAEGSLVTPAASFWAGSNVATSGTNAPELVIGTITPVTQGGSSTLYLYSSTDPDNANDPLKGCYAFRFDVKVIAKATVVPPTGGAGAPQTCYMNETLSARASPLFSRAIFYNMDLELFPGPTMNVLGATHTNGNFYVRKNSSNGNSLNFVGPVTVAGNLIAHAKWPVANADGGIDNLTSGTDNVYFSTVAGGLTGLFGPPPAGGSSIWRDQFWGNATENATTDATFRAWASQTYGGNLQTIVHGVLQQKPPGISNYLEDPTPNNLQDNSINDAHKMIEPPLASGDAGYSVDVESQKYSTRSGIYICVNPTSTARNGRMPDGTVISIPGRGSIGGAAYTGCHYRAFAHNTTTNAMYEIILPGQPDSGPGNTTVNLATSANSPLNLTYSPLNTIITVRVNEMFDMRRSTFDPRSPPRSAANPYNPKSITTIDVDMRALKMAIDLSVNGLNSSQVYSTDFSAFNGVTQSDVKWTGFIYNYTTGVTGASVLPPATPLTGANQITGLAGGAWNGAIYIESIDAHQPAVLSDFVTANSLYRNGKPTLLGNSPTNEPSGVRLINGRGHVASAAPNAGLTIATNDACYVLGHYNADGFINSSVAAGNTVNSGRFPDDAGETACSICCDALTILSAPNYTYSAGLVQISGWNDGLSLLRNNSANSITAWRTTAPSSSNTEDGDDGASGNVKAWKIPYDSTSGTLGNAATQKLRGDDTEISAAFLAGIVVSNKDADNQNSGGAHNYPRFLENHGGTVAIRGSIVAMFESRTAYEPFNLRVYGPPTRLWGFNQLFATGHFPPLTPIVMDYRRLYFNDITAAQYAANKAAWGVP